MENIYLDREKVHFALNCASKNHIAGRKLVDLEEAHRIIDDIAAENVAPVRHGRFDIERECEYSFEHEGYIAFFNYCPSCGAKMDGGVADET